MRSGYLLLFLSTFNLQLIYSQITGEQSGIFEQEISRILLSEGGKNARLIRVHIGNESTDEDFSWKENWKYSYMNDSIISVRYCNERSDYLVKGNTFEEYDRKRK